MLYGGPAAKGGLPVGDVILSVDNDVSDMSADLPHLIGAIKPNTRSKLTIVRDGERKTLTMQVGALLEKGEDGAASDFAQDAATDLAAMLPSRPRSKSTVWICPVGWSLPK